jgi:hypothetical protein
MRVDRRKGRVASIATLSVSCEPHDEALNCRAIGHIADDRADPRRETDLTDAVAWATSNGKTANIIRGRVTANRAGHRHHRRVGAFRRRDGVLFRVSRR